MDYYDKRALDSETLEKLSQAYLELGMKSIANIIIKCFSKSQLEELIEELQKNGK